MQPSCEHPKLVQHRHSAFSRQPWIWHTVSSGTIFSNSNSSLFLSSSAAIAFSFLRLIDSLISSIFYLRERFAFSSLIFCILFSLSTSDLCGMAAICFVLSYTECLRPEPISRGSFFSFSLVFDLFFFFSLFATSSKSSRASARSWLNAFFLRFVLLLSNGFSSSTNPTFGCLLPISLVFSRSLGASP